MVECYGLDECTLKSPPPRSSAPSAGEAGGYRLQDRLQAYKARLLVRSSKLQQKQKKVIFECGSFEVEMILLFCLLAKKPAGLWSDGVGFGIGGVLCAATPAIVNYCVLIIEKN